MTTYVHLCIHTDEVANWCLHALSGGLAGGVARTVTHPLDTVKRRMQAQVGNMDTYQNHVMASSKPITLHIHTHRS